LHCQFLQTGINSGTARGRSREGEIRFWLDGQAIHRSAGGTAFVPRGMPHCSKNCSDRQARVLILFTPGDIEVFFDYGKPLADGQPATLLGLEVRSIGVITQSGSFVALHAGVRVYAPSVRRASGFVQTGKPHLIASKTCSRRPPKYSVVFNSAWPAYDPG
jgi:Cupin domain